MSDMKKIVDGAKREISLVRSRLEISRDKAREILTHDAIAPLTRAAIAAILIRTGYNEASGLLASIHRDEALDETFSRRERLIAHRKGTGCRCGDPVVVKGSPRGEIGIVDRDDPLQEPTDRWAPVSRLTPEGPVVGKGISPRDLKPTLAPVSAPAPTLYARESARARRKRLAHNVVIEHKKLLK